MHLGYPYFQGGTVKGSQLAAHTKLQSLLPLHKILALSSPRFALSSIPEKCFSQYIRSDFYR